MTDPTLNPGDNSAGLSLVTGASGFVGKHLVRYLSEKGKAVRAVYFQNPPAESLKQLNGVEWVKADLLDVYDVDEILNGVSCVYHCAAIVSFNPSDKYKMLHFNVESTINLVNASIEKEIEKFLFISSVAALGRREGKKEITEEEQWEESKYNSKYGLSKHLSEIEVWRGMAEGLKGIIVNPGLILGEGNWSEGTARFFKVVDREFPFYTQGINSWVDVKDLVRIVVSLMECEVTSERFIVSSGNYSYKEVFSRMANALGKKPPHIKAGKFLSSLVWRFSLLKSKITGEIATITKETARNAQKQSFYNNGKLFDCLPGFRYTPLEETIGRIAGAYKAESAGKS
jgi:dihydroflavonol-4-reductase